MVTRRAFLRASAAVAATAAGLGTAGVASAGQRPRWDRLQRRLSGDLVLPSHPGYEQAKQLQLIRYDSVRPRAVAYAETAQDVRDCLLFAQDNDIRVAVRSGGHNYAGWSTTTGMVVDVSRMDHIARTGESEVRFGPGAQNVDVMATLAAGGVGVPGGMCADIGSGGYFSVGGTGLHTRKYGIASDRMLAAEVVLADGRIVHCSAEREPDLFWAIRGGGGGNFGVVTGLKVRTFPVGTTTSFTLVWQWDAAAGVIDALQPWLIDAPDDLTALLTVVVLDAVPGAVADVVLNGVWYGDPAALEPRLDQLVGESGHQPVFRTSQASTFQQAMMSWYGCAELTVEQCHRVGHSPAAMLPRDKYVIDRGRLLSRAVPPAGVAELLDAFDSQPLAGQARLLWLMGLGGRSTRVDRDATAYVHRDTELLLSVVVAMQSPTPDADYLATSRAWAGRGFDIIDRYSNGESYVAFPDLELRDWRESYYAENYRRLVGVKRRYDRHDFFRFARSIGS